MVIIMKKFKQGIRLMFLIFLLVLAAFGVGLTGFHFTNRERYQDRSVRVELRDKREEDD